MALPLRFVFAHRRLFCRERVFRDRTNPFDIFDERECWRGLLACGGYQIDVGDIVYYLPSILYTRAVSSPSMLSIVSTYQGLTADGPPPVLWCFISEAILLRGPISPHRRKPK